MKVSILFGGKSSRMQSEKGLVLYQNKPFIEQLLKLFCHYQVTYN
ncbi:NTP transferase domain-containing protein [Flavobacterium sp. LB2P6]